MKNLSLPDFIYEIDNMVRSDLSEGYIVNERDYMSTLTSYIRFSLKSKSFSNFICHSQSLPSNSEKLFGCDSIFIIKNNDKIKILLIEAKNPKLQRKSNGWDRFEKSKNRSHFGDQLFRQSAWNSTVSICELFIIDYPHQKQPGFYDDFGATCLYHEDVYSYYQNNIEPQKKYRSWTNEHLKKLLPYDNDTKKLNLKKILEDLINDNAYNLIADHGFVELNAENIYRDNIYKILSTQEEYNNIDRYNEINFSEYNRWIINYNESDEQISISIPVDFDIIRNSPEILSKFTKTVGVENFLLFEID